MSEQGKMEESPYPEVGGGGEIKEEDEVKDKLLHGRDSRRQGSHDDDIHWYETRMHSHQAAAQGSAAPALTREEIEDVRRLLAGSRQSPEPAVGQYYTRVKPPKPDTYSGDDPDKSLEDWIYALQMYFRTAQIHDHVVKADFTITLLRGSAQVWARVQSQSNALPHRFDLLIQRLRDQFGTVNPVRLARQKLDGIKQRKQSVREYTRLFQHTALAITPITEDELIHKYASGLNSGERFEVIRNDPKTLNQAIQLADNYAAAMRASDYKGVSFVEDEPSMIGGEGGDACHAAQPTGQARLDFPLQIQSMNEFIRTCANVLVHNRWIKARITERVNQMQQRRPPQMRSMERQLQPANLTPQPISALDAMAAADCKPALDASHEDRFSFISSEEDTAEACNMIIPSGDDRCMAVGKELMNVWGTINGCRVNLLVDTGAAVNVLSETTARKVGASIQPCERKLKGVGGIVVETVGKCLSQVSVGDACCQLDFLVLSGQDANILSKQAIAALGYTIDPANDTLVSTKGGTALKCHALQKKGAHVPAWRISSPECHMLPKMNKHAQNGYDIPMPHDLEVPPKTKVQICTQLKHSLPPGMIAQIIARSDLAGRQGLYVHPSLLQKHAHLAPIRFMIENFGEKPISIKRGQRVAALILHKQLTPHMMSAVKERDTGSTNDNLPIVTLSLLSDLPIAHRPRQDGRCIMFILGKSFVLGALRTRVIQMPIKVVGSLGTTHDCLQLQVALHVKIRADGLIWLILRNWSSEPQHLTTNMKIFWVEGILRISPSLKDHSAQQAMLISHIQPLTTETLTREFPNLFDVSPAGMKITSQMRAMQVTKQHVLWRSPVTWHSDSHFQPISLVDLHATKSELHLLETQGIIVRMKRDEPGYFSQVLIVPKATGKPRITMDVRAVNTFMHTWRNALPSTFYIVSRIPRSWRYFTIVDLYNGFFNVLIDGTLSSLFCFEVDGIRYRWTRLVQGWTSSTGFFHDVVARVIAHVHAYHFVDDLITGGDDVPMHDRNLRDLLQALDDYGFKLKEEKLKICLQTVVFLGFLISKGTFSLAPYAEHVKEKIPTITSKHELRQALGIMNVLKNFIPKFAGIMGPFYELVKPGSSSTDWAKVDQHFRQTASTLLASAYSLQRSVDCSEYVLYSDWSGEGYGYALFAEHALIHIGSRRLQFWKSQVSSFLGEASAIHWAIKRTFWITRGRRLRVLSDSISAVKKFNNPASWVAESDKRILRILGFLITHFAIGDSLIFEFVPGLSNDLADALSRWKGRSVSVMTRPKVQSLIQNTEHVEDINIMRHFHHGHVGARGMMELALLKGLRLDPILCRRFVRECLTCQRFSQRYIQSAFGVFSAPSQPGHTLGLDFIGPLKRSDFGNRYICCLMDQMSRYGVAVACPSANAQTAIRMLEMWICLCGSIQYLMLDPASYFRGHQLQTFAQSQGIKLVFTAPYAHHSGGAVERFNRTIICRVRRMAYDLGNSETKWDRVLEEAATIVQNVPNVVTSYAPRLLFHGLDANGVRMSDADLESARARACELTQLQRQKRNKGKTLHKWIFKPGDLIWLFDNRVKERLDAKMLPLWHGPHLVHEVESDHILIVELIRGRSGFVRVHINFAKPVFSAWDRLCSVSEGRKA